MSFLESSFRLKAGDVWKDSDLGYKSGDPSKTHNYSDNPYYISLAEKPTETFQQGQSVIPDPIFEEQESGADYMSNLIAGNDRKETLMQVMYPDRDYKPPKIDAKSLMRDANKAVTDGNIVTQKAAGGREALNEKKGEFTQDWKQAKVESTSQLLEAAKNTEGVNPADAEDQMVAKGQASSAGMVAGVVADAVTGGGTLATFGTSGNYLRQELSQKDKQLSAKEQKALLEDNLKNLQASRKPVDTREASSSSGRNASIAEANSGLEKSDIAWENMEIADLAELLQADPDGLDQPEMEELMMAEHELDEVDANHDYVAEHYADNVTMDKMKAAAEHSGAMRGLMEEAEVAPSAVQSSDDIEIAGASVNDYSMRLPAGDPGFDSKSVETVTNWNMLNIAEVKQELSREANMQFGGMRA